MGFFDFSCLQNGDPYFCCRMGFCLSIWGIFPHFAHLFVFARWGALYFPAIWGILAWQYGELLLFPRVYDEFFPRNEQYGEFFLILTLIYHMFIL